MITEASLEILRNRIDIVDIVGNYVELKKAGADFKGLCPFHDEKSPSFTVSPSKQIYHCFGCQAGGDAIGFVQEHKKLDFAEAAEQIAADLGVTLEYTSGTTERRDYAGLMEHVNTWYRNNLPPHITDYLHERGLTDDSMSAFELGYVPAAKDAQIHHIKDAMFSENDAITVGILGRSENGVFARLTDRLTFPIRNHAGKLIGFAGRILPGSDHPAKYINSPQTILFDKSRQFYGYHIAKNSIYAKSTFTITEGYMDVVMFHQAGIRTAVATMGTALTDQHCRLIKKVPGARVLLCYDGDRAGRAAALKAARLLSAREIDGGVVLFPDGKDPADMVKAGDIDALYDLLRHPTGLIAFVVEEIIAGHDITRPEAKLTALRDIEDYTHTLPALIRDEYRPYIAHRLKIDIAHIARADTKAEPAQVQHTYINIAELSVIKTAAENDAIVDAILDIVSAEDFEYHRREFEMLLTADTMLQGPLLEPALIVYTPDQLLQQLHVMRINTLQKQLTSLQMEPSLDFDTKAKKIIQIKTEIVKHQKQLTKK